MIETNGDNTIDLLLLPYLRAPDDATAQTLVAELITTHAEPVLRRTIPYKLRRLAHNASPERLRQEAEDIHSDVMLQLLARLDRLRRSPADVVGGRIADFGNYVAACAYNACDSHASRNFPLRRRLKRELRALFAARDELKLWEGDGRVWWCRVGEEEEKGRREEEEKRRDEARDVGVSLAELRDDPAAFARVALGSDDLRAASLGVLVVSVLRRARAAVEFEILVSAVAECWDIKDQILDSPREDGEDFADEIESAADERADVAAEVERNQYLQRLWAEINELPTRQRAALLLNLRDGNGMSVIDLLIISGIATPHDIARALDLDIAEYAELSTEVPLDDLTIAARLGITRQQVINLRKSARERLARRLKDF